MNRALLLALSSLTVLTVPLPGLAHSVEISYQETEAIAIQVHYNTGEPMAQAQVLVYAPQQPDRPWTTGLTDATGRFVFTLTREQPGNWQVKVQQAGHGATIAIPIQATATTAVMPTPQPAATNTPAAAASPMPGLAAVVPNQNGSSLSPGQQWLLAGAVVWGLVGTALFFSRGKKKNAHS